MINSNYFLSALTIVVIAGCSSFGSVSMSYDAPRQRIWTSIERILIDEYGGVQEVLQNPPTAVSKIKLKDAEFGLEKSSFQAFVVLSGFSRPYSVDIEVREYPTDKASDNYRHNVSKAGEILEKIKDIVGKQEASNLIKDFRPY
jgi:hypothetical protein